jgi:hypothetical protein
MYTPPHIRRVLWTAAAALAAGFVVAPMAHAGPLVAAAPSCDAQVLDEPFLPWADPASYTLVPNGTVETTRKWSLDGAAPANGNEKFYVNASDDVKSLSLPSGTSATTPAICVGIEHPTLRFFARNRGSRFSALLVKVRWEDASGRVWSTPIGAVTGDDGWAPTPPLPVVVNLLPLLPGERTAVAFEFTVLGDGDWRVDDLYVDPWRHG